MLKIKLLYFLSYFLLFSNVIRAEYSLKFVPQFKVNYYLNYEGKALESAIGQKDMALGEILNKAREKFGQEIALVCTEHIDPIIMSDCSGKIIGANIYFTDSGTKHALCHLGAGASLGLPLCESLDLNAVGLAAREKYIRLIPEGSDKALIVPMRIARMSGAIATLLSDLGDKNESEIPVQVSAHDLEFIVKILKKLKPEFNEARIYQEIKSTLEDKYPLREPSNIDKILNIFKAADYLDIKDLRRTAAIVVIDAIKAKSPDNIVAWKNITEKLAELGFSREIKAIFRSLFNPPEFRIEKPNYMAFYKDKLYVANSSGEIWVINLGNYEIKRMEIKIIGRLKGIAANENKLYVVSVDKGILIYDLKSAQGQPYVTIGKERFGHRFEDRLKNMSGPVVYKNNVYISDYYEHEFLMLNNENQLINIYNISTRHVFSFFFYKNIVYQRSTFGLEKDEISFIKSGLDDNISLGDLHLKGLQFDASVSNFLNQSMALLGDKLFLVVKKDGNYRIAVIDLVTEKFIELLPWAKANWSGSIAVHGEWLYISDIQNNTISTIDLSSFAK